MIRLYWFDKQLLATLPQRFTNIDVGTLAEINILSANYRLRNACAAGVVEVVGRGFQFTAKATDRDRMALFALPTRRQIAAIVDMMPATFSNRHIRPRLIDREDAARKQFMQNLTSSGLAVHVGDTRAADGAFIWRKAEGGGTP